MQLAFVTGASGFVGSYLVRKLLAKDYQVRAFIRRKSDSSIPSHLLETRDLYPGQVEIIRGDITNYRDVEDAMCETDVVFHLASQSFVPDSVNNPSYTHEVNAGGTLNILEAARGYPLTKVIYTSSSEVYGFQWPDELPLDEQSITRPQSPYASAKLYGELLAKNYHDNYGVPVVTTRAFNHEGAGRGHHFVTASIVRQMVMIKKKEKDFLLVGDVTPTRDWNHVSDIVDGYILLSEIGIPGEVYVLGSGIETSVNDFIKRVQLLLSIDDLRVYQIKNLTRKADVPRLRSSSKKIRDLGWNPQLGLDDIITEMIAYYNGMTEKQRDNLEQPIDEPTEITLTGPPVNEEKDYPFIEKDRRIK